MTVDDRYPAETHAAQAAQPSDLQEAERPGEVAQPDSRNGGGADKARPSDRTGGLACVLSASDQERASRIRRLAQQYSEGQYRVDPQALSQAIAAQMRTESG